MTTLVLLWTLYLVTVLGVAAAAVGLRLRIPRPILVAFALLPVLVMLPAFTSGKTPVPVDHALAIPPWSAVHPGVARYNENLNDIAMQFVPWAKAVRLAFQEGTLPLRNRWNGGGMVLAANSQSGAFYPPLLLGGLLPLAAAFSLVAAIKTFLALTGMWLWLRELRLTSAAALFGAIAFSLSLTMTAWLLFPHTAVTSLWPWALFAIELLRREDGRAGFWTATCVLTVWALGGHPESAASGAAFALVWLLARAALRDLPDWRRLGRRLLAAAATGTGLAAFLLLPSVLAILASNRLGFWGVFWGPHLSLAPHGPIWRAGGLALFFPRIFGDGISSPMIPGMASYPEMGLGYIGIAGWACALLILRARKGPPRAERALIVPLAAGFAFGVGLWPFAEVLAMVPALKLMFPVRFFSWIALAGAAIAAFELDRMCAELRTRRGAPHPAIFAAAALGLAAISAYRLVRPLHEASGGLEEQSEWIAFTLIAVAGFALAVLAGNRGAFGLAAILTAINGAELYLEGQRIYRFGSPDRLFPPTPVVRWLASRPPPFRVVGDGAAIFPNSNVHAGVEEIRTHDPVERSDYVRFLDAVAGYPPADYFKQLRDRDAAVLDFLNVRYWVAPSGQAPPGGRWKPAYSGPDAVVFENSSVLPRAFVPAAVRLVPPPRSSRILPPADALAPFEKSLSEMAALRDWRSVAFVAADAGSGSWRAGAQPAVVAVGDYRESTNGASFGVANHSDRVVTIVASLAQDGGWSADTESGLSLPMAPANGPFLAIAVPPGEHRVRLRYLSPGFAAGAAVSGATALLLAAVLWTDRRRSPASGMAA
ncbi:MAG: hypothetical protein ABR576_01105 [Thermoanaerobaculia bacterium]